MSTESLSHLGARTVRTVSQASSVDIELSPPALDASQIAVRVVGGTALAGVYQVTDAGGTPVDSATLGMATLSADGATLTFAAAVTDAELSYLSNHVSSGQGG